MELDIFVVDAFTDTQFKGNSAAVVPLQEWLEPDLMQNIAAEQRTAITFSDITRNGSIDRNLFNFDIPEGTDVIREEL